MSFWKCNSSVCLVNRSFIKLNEYLNFTLDLERDDDKVRVASSKTYIPVLDKTHVTLLLYKCYIKKLEPSTIYRINTAANKCAVWAQ